MAEIRKKLDILGTLRSFKPKESVFIDYDLFPISPNVMRSSIFQAKAKGYLPADSSWKVIERPLPSKGIEVFRTV